MGKALDRLNAIQTVDGSKKSTTNTTKKQSALDRLNAIQTVDSPKAVASQKRVSDEPKTVTTKTQTAKTEDSKQTVKTQRQQLNTAARESANTAEAKAYSQALARGVAVPRTELATKAYEFEAQNPEPSALERIGKTIRGGAKGSLASNVNAEANIYELGQGQRDALYDDIVQQKQRDLDRALSDMNVLVEMGANKKDISAQQNVIDSLRREISAYQTGKEAQRGATKETYKIADKVQESSQKDIERAKEGLGTLGSMVVDAGAAMTQVGLDAAGNVLTGGPSMLPFAFRAYGGGTQQARQEGASAEKAATYGLATAAKEVFTEKMFNVAMPFTKAYGGGALDDTVKSIINRAVNKVARTEVGKRLLGGGLTLATSGIGEGLEELVGDWIEWQMPRIYGGDVESASDTLAQSLYDFAVGGISGLMGGAADLNTYNYRGQDVTANDIVNALAAEEAAQTAETQAAEADAQATQAQAAEAITQEERTDTVNTVVKKIKEAIPQIKDMASVATLEGTEFAKNENKNFIQQVSEFFAGLGNKVLRKGFGEVVLDAQGARSDVAHGLGRAKAITMKAVPDVIAKGQQIDYVPNWKTRKYDSYIFAAPVDLNGKTTYVGAVVSRGDKNRFYLHEVVDENENIIYIKKDASEAIKTGVTAQDGITRASATSSNDIITDTSEKSNTQSSQPITNPEQRAQAIVSGVVNKLTERTAETTGRALGVAESTIQAAKEFSEKTGRKVLFKDYGNPKFKGEYNNGVIYLNSQTKTPILDTLIHELTHHAERGGVDYADFQNAVFESPLFNDFLNGRSLAELRNEIKETYAAQGVELSPNAVNQEITARFAEQVLFKNQESIDRLARRDSTLFDRVASWISYMKTQLTGTAAEKELARLERMYKRAKEKADISVGVIVDSKSESAAPSQFSLASWSRSDYAKAKKTAANDIASVLGVTLQDAEKYIDNINSIAKIIADDQERLDYEASPGRSSFVGNTEYGGSLDFSTIYKKRRLLTGTIDAIQEAMPNTTLTSDDMLRIRSMMKERGYEVSCGLCYVEGSRVKIGEYTEEFLSELRNKNLYVPTMAEINTTSGQERIRREHPEVYEQYVAFMNKLAQRKPKLFQMATEYDGEILNKFRNDKSVQDKNKNGGLRFQSFSDFEIIHLIDCMQAIMDMSRVGLAGQAYTKVPDFAWALGDTGLKINLSLIAKDVDVNGNLILDEVEGMKRDEAEELRNRYSDNVGTILVVFTDEQLQAAMADPFIDFIIPFHRSQWSKAQYDAIGLPTGTKDYTDQQNESYIKKVVNKNGKAQRPSNYMPNEYWDFEKSGKENAEAYLQMCAENNRRPKFYKLLVNNGDGSYSLQPDGSTDGYWKLLIDFKMYNNDGVGVPQQPVVPNFNMQEAERMLNEYEGGHQTFPAAEDVVNDFVAEKERDQELGIPEIAQAQVEMPQYSIDPDYADDVQEWYDNGQPEGQTFVLGSTGDVLQGLGAIENDIYINGDKIIDILNEHPEITLDTIKRIPELLDDPVLILKSRGANTSGQNTRLPIFGSVKATNGQPVMVVLDLRPVEDHLVVDNMQKVNSAYTRKNPIKFLQQSDVLYADKKRTASLLKSMGLQIRPIELQRSGSIGSITYGNRSVNITGVPFSAVVNLQGDNSQYSIDSPLKDIPPNTGAELPSRAPAAQREGDRISSFAENVQNSTLVADEVKEAAASDANVVSYQGITNEETMKQAATTVDEAGALAANQFFNAEEGKSATAEDVAIGLTLLDRYQKAGDFKTALNVLEKLRKMGSTAGQAVQMFSLLSRLTPEGMLAYSERTLSEARERMIKGKTKEWIEKHEKDFTLTDEEAEAITRRVVQAADMPEGRDRDILLGEINSIIQSKIPTNLANSYKAWRRISMLLNLRTNVRNVLGNAIITPEHIFGDLIGSGIDKAIATKTGVRTTGRLHAGEAVKGLKKGAYESWDDFARKINTRGIDNDRWETGDGPSFSTKTRLGRSLNALDRICSFCLDFGDRPFFQMWFINSLNNQMRLNNATEPTAGMIEIATQEALQRTWQDENGYTKMVSTIRNALNVLYVGGYKLDEEDGSKTSKLMSHSGGYGLGDMILPFVKTPANLTKAIVDFSPIGLTKALTNDAIKFSRAISTGQVTPKMQRDFVRTLSQGITGTIFMLIAALIANAGTLSGGGDDDKDVAAFEKNVLGIMPYSVKIGDKSYSYEWAQPVASNAAIMADIVKIAKSGKYTKFVSGKEKADMHNIILSAIGAGGSIILNQSFLGTLQNFFGGGSGNLSGDGLVKGLIDTAVGEPATLIPTLFSQVAQATDDTARASWEYQDYTQTAINKVMAKLVGARGTLAPSVDVLGREVEANNNLFDVFVNPANYVTAKPTAESEEMYRLYQSTGDKGVIPPVAPYYVKYNDEKYVLNSKSRAEYQKTMGTVASDAVKELMQKSAYRKLSDEEKVAVIKDLYTYAESKAKSNFIDGYYPQKTNARIAAASGVGVSPAEYLLFMEIKDGNSYAASEEAISKMGGLSEKKKAILWQLADISREPKKNPYKDKTAAENIYNILQNLKRSGRL